jgi:hypothetical protein
MPRENSLVVSISMAIVSVFIYNVRLTILILMNFNKTGIFLISFSHCSVKFLRLHRIVSLKAAIMLGIVIISNK